MKYVFLIFYFWGFMGFLILGFSSFLKDFISIISSNIYFSLFLFFSILMTLYLDVSNYTSFILPRFIFIFSLFFFFLSPPLIGHSSIWSYANFPSWIPLIFISYIALFILSIVFPIIFFPLVYLFKVLLIVFIF